jgi:hypothetical protein
MPILIEKICDKCKSRYYGIEESNLCYNCNKKEYLNTLKRKPIKERLEKIEKLLYDFLKLGRDK